MVPKEEILTSDYIITVALSLKSLVDPMSPVSNSLSCSSSNFFTLAIFSRSTKAFSLFYRCAESSCADWFLTVTSSALADGLGVSGGPIDYMTPNLESSSKLPIS